MKERKLPKRQGLTEKAVSVKKAFNETNLQDANPFATPERAESADGWQFVDAPPTVGPSFRGAFWYCLRRPFDFKSRANRTEYFGCLAGLVVALFTLGFVAGLGTWVPVAWARATKEIPFVFLGAVVFLGFVLPFSLAAAIMGAAVRRLRCYDRDGERFLSDVVLFVVAFLFALGYITLNLSLDGVFEILGAALLVAVAATLFWPSTIFLTGYCCCAALTTSLGAENPAFPIAGVLIILLGLLVRVVRYCRAGTPGPNRFGAERLTPKEAARRERAQNAENGLIVENETV